MKKLFMVAVFLWGCDSPPVHIPRRYAAPPRVLAVEITIKDDDTYYDCINRGGIWVRGDSRQFINEIVGCIEPKSPDNGQKTP